MYGLCLPVHVHSCFEDNSVYQCNSGGKEETQTHRYLDI